MLKAEVLWWNDQDVAVRCPYCSSWHRHFVTQTFEEKGSDAARDAAVERLVEYNQRSHRTAPCVLDYPTQYTLIFSLSKYEIEKPWDSGIGARFVSTACDAGRVPSMRAWESNSPFGDLQEEWAVVEELEVAEREYHVARSESIRADTVPLAFKDSAMSKNDPQSNFRSMLKKCEDELRAAKNRYKTALSLCLKPSSDSKKRIDTSKNLGTSMKDVIKATRSCCCEYRRLASNRVARAEAEHQEKTKTKDEVEDIVETFSKLEVAAETPRRGFVGAENMLNGDLSDKIAEVKGKLSDLSIEEPKNTVALLECGGSSEYIKIKSGTSDVALTQRDELAPPLLLQAFDVAEDVGFEFVDRKGIDSKNMKSDPDWRVGQYNACHVESKSIALFINRHVFLSKERKGGHPLYPLWKARPPQSATAAMIYVDHVEVCPSCRSFITAVNAALGTSISTRCIPCKQRFCYKKRETFQQTFADIVEDIPARVPSNIERASIPLPSENIFSSVAPPSKPGEKVRAEVQIMDELTLDLSSMSVISRSEIRVLETNGEVSQAPEAAPWCPRPQTPPRRLSSASQFSSSPRRSSYTSSGTPRSPRKPVVCFNCGADHYSTFCLRPKSSREQQQIHKEETWRQRAEWKRSSDKNKPGTGG